MSSNNTNMTIDAQAVNTVVNRIEELKSELVALSSDLTSSLEVLSSNIRGESANKLLNTYIEKYNSVSNKISSLLDEMNVFVSGQMTSYSDIFGDYNSAILDLWNKMGESYGGKN